MREKNWNNNKCSTERKKKKKEKKNQVTNHFLNKASVLARQQGLQIF